MTSLDDDTLLTVEADGEYSAEVPDTWTLFLPNGGFVSVLALRATSKIVSAKRPISISCNFLRVVQPGPVKVVPRLLSRGNGLEAVGVHIMQKGKTVVEAVVWSGDDRPGVSHLARRAPTVGDPHGLRTHAEEWPPGPDRLRLWDHLEGRVIPGYGAGAHQRPEVVTWHRFLSGSTFSDPFVDAGRSLILGDAYTGVAAIWPYQEMGIGFPITMQLSATFWATTSSEWLLVDAASPSAMNGYLEGTALIWDQERQPIASLSSQMTWIGTGLPTAQ